MTDLRLQAAAFALALLAPSPASAAPAGAHDPEELIAVLQVAKREFADHIDRCAATGGALLRDDESERVFAGAAGMLLLFINNYPYPPGAEPERTEHVRDAVLAFERAFDCSPHWDKRHFIEDALALVRQRQREIAAEKRPKSKPETDALAEDAQRITRRLEALTPPPPPKPKVEPPPPPPPPMSAPEPTGYARWVDRLSLRLELGGGRVRFKEYLTPSVDTAAFTFALAAGVRFLAGAQRRHVFTVGSAFGSYRLRSEVDGEPHTVSTFVARLDYGLRLHPRWLSVHPSFEAGIEAQTRKWDFGRGLFGFSFALCTASEALCARTRSAWTVLDNSDFMDIPVVVLLSFDPFRVADLALGQKGAAP